MNRAVAILIGAVLALALVHTATTLSARTPTPQDTPTVQIITSADGVYLPAYEGEGGDADDLAGHKDKKPTGVDSFIDVIQARMAMETWRSHFFFILGLYR